MIQRVQSIYLIISSFFYFLYWFFGLEWYQKGFGKIIETFKNSFDISPILSIISIIPFLIFLICLITVFLFKKRRIQLLLSNLALKLSLLMSIFTLFYFYIAFDTLISIMPSKFFELLLFAAILNPFFCSILIFLAVFHIKKDIELLSSINRLR